MMENLPPILFNRARNRKHRARTARNFAQHDFLWREAAARAEDSLAFIARYFPLVLNLGPQGFAASNIKKLFTADELPTTITDAVLDAERFPFAAESFDAVISLLSLHTVNDLPGSLKQIWHMLKPDGMFFAIMPGGETLRELRDSFAAVETKRTGGITPRIAPFLDVRDAGALLQRAGFNLPVADSEKIQVSYENLFALMDDLRGSGQANMLQQQAQHFTPKSFFLDAAKYYADHFSDGEGRITATVEFVTLTGWKPAPNQQQPAKRGSGKVSLTQVLN